MKEHPILFSTPMVQAILAGRKTMTRRVVKHHPLIDCGFSDTFIKHPDNYVAEDCPYKVRAKIWVRETFGLLQEYDEHEPIFYKADYTQEDFETQVLPKWKPSIFMPRKFSRITLEITNARVERLQEITEEDAIKEGINYYLANGGKQAEEMSMKVQFSQLWDSINGKKYPWSANPWVWRYELEKI